MDNTIDNDLRFFSEGIVWSENQPSCPAGHKSFGTQIQYGQKLLPGPPKRFAQSIGLIFSTSIFILWLINFHVVSIFLLSILSIFAFLESALGYCFACKVFKILISVGLIPEEVCERCAVYEY